MASFKFDKAERKAVIQFWDGNRKRRTVRLSDVSRTFAERTCSSLCVIQTAAKR